jgi:hypothetical protein
VPPDCRKKFSCKSKRFSVNFRDSRCVQAYGTVFVKSKHDTSRAERGQCLRKPMAREF